MKTKEIIAAVNNLKVTLRGVCDKCQNLPLETPALVKKLHDEWHSRLDAIAATANDDSDKMETLIGELRQAFQAVCLTCSNVSNDDNPSNHGQTFVSLDSGNCQANSGRAKTTHTDDNVVLSRADWIGAHSAPEVDNSRSFGMAPDISLMMKEEPEAFDNRAGSSTLLPPEVEDRLRAEFSNFVSLDIIDKLLLSCIMSGMNIAEFSKMLWFPYSIVDPKTRMVKSITKQAAHARWINICKRFPTFMAIAASSGKNSKETIEKLRKFVADPNGDEPNNKFANGKLSPHYLKSIKKKQDEADKKIAEKISRLETEAAILRKVNENLKHSLAKAEKKAEKVDRPKNRQSSQNENMTELLPGLL